MNRSSNPVCATKQQQQNQQLSKTATVVTAISAAISLVICSVAMAAGGDDRAPQPRCKVAQACGERLYFTWYLVASDDSEAVIVGFDCARTGARFISEEVVSCPTGDGECYIRDHVALPPKGWQPDVAAGVGDCGGLAGRR
jgi:hypothetical protein